MWEMRRLNYESEGFRKMLGLSNEKWKTLKNSPEDISLEDYCYILDKCGFTASLSIFDREVWRSEQYEQAFKRGRQRQIGLEITGLNLFEMSDDELEEVSKDAI